MPTQREMNLECRKPTRCVFLSGELCDYMALVGHSKPKREYPGAPCPVRKTAAEMKIEKRTARDALFMTLYQKGLTDYEIMDKAKVSRGIVRRWRFGHGLPANQKPR